MKFKEVYSLFFKKENASIFISAHKYVKLEVISQFQPFINNVQFDLKENPNQLHNDKYGNNLIINSSRYPISNLLLIDKSTFNSYKIAMNKKNIIEELFSNIYLPLGYIDKVFKK